MEQREIKFRGYATGIGWVYGSLVNNLWQYSELSQNKKGSPVYEIITSEYTGDCWSDIAEQEGETILSVVPESVGQFTGLKDKNGKEIYEGDVLEENNNGKIIRYLIKWNIKSAGFIAESKEIVFGIGVIDHSINEVIGNIFQNNKLL